MQITVDKDHATLSRTVAQAMAAYINAHPGALLCLAAGDTPLASFAELVRLQDEDKVNLSSVDYVGLDEWKGIGYETPGSCMQVMQDHFYGPARIPEEKRLVWDGRGDLEAQRGAMERWMAAHGGIGLTLLGIGMNGHIGFNEPGAKPNALTDVVALDGVTARVGKKYFAGGVVPDTGVTVGIQALRSADAVLLLASGEKKAPIVRKMLWEPATAQVPVSLVMDHPTLGIYLDASLWAALA